MPIGSDRFARARRFALLVASVGLPALIVGGCGGGSHAAGPAAASVNAPVAGGTSTTATGASTTATGASTTGAPPARVPAVPAPAKTAPSGSQPTHAGSSGKPAAKAKRRAAAKSGAGAGAGAGGSGSGGSGAGGSSGAGAVSPQSGVPYPVETSSMEPTYQPETKVYYDPTATHPQVGQVVVFYLPAGGEEGACGEAMIGGRACANPEPGMTKAKITSLKRVVGLPGDTIAIHEGHVIRNGQPEAEPPILPCGKDEKVECEFPTPLTVPAGHYYVMADSRGLPKEDSRIFGAVPQEYILGTVAGS